MGRLLMRRALTSILRLGPQYLKLRGDDPSLVHDSSLYCIWWESSKAYLSRLVPARGLAWSHLAAGTAGTCLIVLVQVVMGAYRV